jgi:hypothetical protein
MVICLMRKPACEALMCVLGWEMLSPLGSGYKGLETKGAGHGWGAMDGRCMHVHLGATVKHE